MATPAETPSVPTGGPESTVPAPVAPEPVGGPPEAAPVAPVADPGGPVIQPDGVITSGRGSNQDAPPSTPAEPAATPSPQAQPGTAPASEQVSDLPDWAQKVIKDARDDAAKARTTAKSTAAEEARKAMAEDIGRALGIITDDTPPEDKLSPDELKSLLAGERTTAKGARVELAVFKAAQAGGNFNVTALLDSRQFLDSIKDVDPNNAEALATKIAEAVTANPWLQSQSAPVVPAPVAAAPGAPVPVAPVAPAPVAVPPSGGSFAGGPGGEPQDLSTMSIDDFRKLRRNAPRP